MQVTSLILGIVATLGMMIGLFPCMGWFNWLNVPFACVGLIIGAVTIGISKDHQSRNLAIAGVVCCGLAVLVGILRLIVGLGVF